MKGWSPTLRPLLHRVLETMEACSLVKVDPVAGWKGKSNSAAQVTEWTDEVRNYLTSPPRHSLEALSAILWAESVKERRPVLWLIREHSALTSVLYLLFRSAQVPLERLATSTLEQQDCKNLHRAIVHLGRSPLVIARVPCGDSFKLQLESARRWRWKPMIFCDWGPSAAELTQLGEAELKSLVPSRYSSHQDTP